jgi:hypothetical protein
MKLRVSGELPAHMKDGRGAFLGRPSFIRHQELLTMTSAATISTTASPLSAPAADTMRANRAAALASYLNACRNVGTVPDPALLAEHGTLTGYTEIDVMDDYLVIEAQVDPDTLGWTRADRREPASATLIANGMLAVSLTFRGVGMPTVVLENLHNDRMLVVDDDSTDRRLFSGAIETG